MVGARAFEKLSIAYLSAHPSRSFTLRNLGSKLPEWLAANPRVRGPAASACARCGAHRVGICRGVRQRGAHAADTGSDRDARCRFAARAAAAPAPRRPGLSGRRSCAWPSPTRKAPDKRSGCEARRGAGCARKVAETAPQRQHGWPPIAWNSVYYRRLEREEFLTLAAIRQGLPLAEALAAGFRRFAHAGDSPRTARPGVVCQLGGTGLDLRAGTRNTPLRISQQKDERYAKFDTHCLTLPTRSLPQSAGWLQSPLLLAIRLYWGWQFAQDGWGKLTHLDRVTEFFASLNLPAPGLTALVVALIEFARRHYCSPSASHRGWFRWFFLST